MCSIVARGSGILRIVGFAIPAFLFATGSGCASSTATRLAIEEGPSTVTVREGDRPILVYRRGDVPFKPYVQRLFTPSGVNVLLDSPADHKHHHGLMFAMSVEGVDFWSEGAQMGRQKPTWGQEEPAAWTFEQGGSRIARYSRMLEWLGPNDEAVLHELRDLDVYQVKNLEATLLTWRTRVLSARRDASATLSGAHYVGLGMRFVESVNKTGTFLNASGQPGEIVRGDERVVRANWSACTGDVDGHPVTVAMFDHPANARHPATWFTMREPFAYMSATLNLWKEPLKIEAGQKLDLCYGVAVWDGHVEPAKIEALYQRWLKVCDRK